MTSTIARQALRLVPTALHLYTAPYSGCSARIRIAAALKSVGDLVPIQYHSIDYTGFEHRSQEYRSINPNASVPTLVVEYAQHGATANQTNDTQNILETNGKHTLTITQSPAILDWLEQNFPSPSLLPSSSDPWARAKVLELASLVVSDIQPPQSTRYRQKIVADYGGDGEAWARSVYERGLSVYETLLARSSDSDFTGSGTKGKYSVGDQVTMADICLVPAAQGAIRVGIDLGRWPMVKEVVDECWKLPEFQKGGLGQHGRLDPR
ncbi:glutathione S-transferase [Dendrothele bispora CBS 962.96]|uniref:Glutathione S-transferase n=1 Tax=Dendrothele bispora (strain CBS 962.96) TaxID=1314807 RepID=A0A4S8M0F1_DENBC|nr:glutathione S-transferase [Dendrothele bispora CBS 962.96]